MEQINFKSGEVIFRQGDYQTWMYAVVDGAVEIRTDYGTAADKLLAVVEKGGFFGEIGMIAMVPRTAAAVAAQDTVLEQVSYDSLKDYLIRHPENMRLVMQSVSGRIRELTEDLTAVTRAAKDAQGRRGGLNGVAELARSLRLRLQGSGRTASAGVRREKTLTDRQAPPSVTFRPGQVIFRSGEEAGCLYEILEGSVSIYADYGMASQKKLAVLSRDQLFGEMGILDDMPRSATAVAEQGCSVLMVDRAYFEQYFRDKPMKMLQLLQQMCMQLRSLTGQYLEVCTALEQLQEQSDRNEEAAWQTVDLLAQSRMEGCLYDNPSRMDWLFY